MRTKWFGQATKIAKTRAQKASSPDFSTRNSRSCSTTDGRPPTAAAARAPGTASRPV